MRITSGCGSRPQPRPRRVPTTRSRRAEPCSRAAMGPWPYYDTPSEGMPAGVSASRRTAWIAWLAGAVPVVVAALFIGYTSIFSHYLWYDDEGYVMISVQGYLRGHPLFREVYTQYVLLLHPARHLRPARGSCIARCEPADGPRRGATEPRRVVKLWQHLAVVWPQRRKDATGNEGGRLSRPPRRTGSCHHRRLRPVEYVGTDLGIHHRCIRHASAFTTPGPGLSRAPDPGKLLSARARYPLAGSGSLAPPGTG